MNEAWEIIDTVAYSDGVYGNEGEGYYGIKPRYVFGTLKGSRNLPTR